MLLEVTLTLQSSQGHISIMFLQAQVHEILTGAEIKEGRESSVDKINMRQNLL